MFSLSAYLWLFSLMLGVVAGALIIKEEKAKAEAANKRMAGRTITLLRETIGVLNGNDEYVTHNDRILIFAGFRVHDICFALKHCRILPPEGSVMDVLCKVARVHFPDLQYREFGVFSEFFLLREQIKEVNGDLSLVKKQEQLKDFKAFFTDCLHALEAIG